MGTTILGKRWPPALVGTWVRAVVAGDGMELLVVAGVCDWLFSCQAGDGAGGTVRGSAMPSAKVLQLGGGNPSPTAAWIWVHWEQPCGEGLRDTDG